MCHGGYLLAVLNVSCVSWPLPVGCSACVICVMTASCYCAAWSLLGVLYMYLLFVSLRLPAGSVTFVMWFKKAARRLCCICGVCHDNFMHLCFMCPIGCPVCAMCLIMAAWSVANVIWVMKADFWLWRMFHSWSCWLCNMCHICDDRFLLGMCALSHVMLQKIIVSCSMSQFSLKTFSLARKS